MSHKCLIIAIFQLDVHYICVIVSALISNKYIINNRNIRVYVYDDTIKSLWYSDIL